MRFSSSNKKPIVVKRARNISLLIFTSRKGNNKKMCNRMSDGVSVSARWTLHCTQIKSEKKVRLCRSWRKKNHSNTMDNVSRKCINQRRRRANCNAMNVRLGKNEVCCCSHWNSFMNVITITMDNQMVQAPKMMISNSRGKRIKIESGEMMMR